MIKNYLEDISVGGRVGKSQGLVAIREKQHLSIF